MYTSYNTPSEFEIEDTMLMKYFGNGGAVVIPEGVTDIFFEVFSGNITITKISIPGSIPDITYYEFEDCTALTEATLCEGVKTIGYAAFRDCTSLTKIILPKSVTCIEKHAFAGCRSLKEICFGGSKTEWSMLKKEEAWDADTGDYRITYGDAEN